jgi:hypothetical protein
MAGVRGIVASGGEVDGGDGFVVERTGPGAYTIGFAERHPDPPVVVVTPRTAGHVAAVAASTIGAEVRLTNLSGVPADAGFGFVVEPIG